MGAYPSGANGYAKVNARSPSAFGICDRCGFRYNRVDLVWQHEWAGAQVQNKRILVCQRTCLDLLQEQLRVYALPPDPLPVPYPRPEMANMQPGLLGLGVLAGVGAVYLTSPRGSGYPEGSAFLAPGMVWSDTPTLIAGQFVPIHVVPGSNQDPSVPAMFFGTATYLDLLNYGGAGLPTEQPEDATQLWDNQGLVWVGPPIVGFAFGVGEFGVTGF